MTVMKALVQVQQAVQCNIQAVLGIIWKTLVMVVLDALVIVMREAATQQLTTAVVVELTYFQKTGIYSGDNMAIKKDITKEDGTTVGYWKIIEMWINYKNSVTAVQLEGYLSQEFRLEGKSPSCVHPVSLNGVVESREAAYNLLKSTPKFLDAEDC